MIDAVLEALALKDVPRTGWRRRGLADVESVAAHSWGMALLVLVLCPLGLDRERCLIYAVLHDLAEAWTGDHPPQDGVEDKPAREDAAMEALCDRLGRPELLAIWRAYEAQVDPEARFVKQLDRLDMGLQAHRYAFRGLDPAEFLASASRALSTDLTHHLTQAAPLRTASVRFTGEPALVALAASLAADRFGDRMAVFAAVVPSAQVAAALAEDRVPLHSGRDGTAAVEITIGPAATGSFAWRMAPPGETATGHRIARDALRRRLDGLLPV